MERKGPISEEHPTDERAKGTDPVERTKVIPQKYVVQKNADHDNGPEGTKLRIRWHKYTAKEATWESPHHLSRNLIVGSCTRNGMIPPSPAVLRTAEQG